MSDRHLHFLVLHTNQNISLKISTNLKFQIMMKFSLVFTSYQVTFGDDMVLF